MFYIRCSEERIRVKSSKMAAVDVITKEVGQPGQQPQRNAGPVSGSKTENVLKMICLNGATFSIVSN